MTINHSSSASSESTAWNHFRRIPCYRPHYTVSSMFAQKLVVEIIVGQERRPCPLEWLDSFCMRNFTGSAEFDDTLPVAEGQLEAGFRVSPARLAQALGDWATQRGKGGGHPVQVEVRVEVHTNAPSASDSSPTNLDNPVWLASPLRPLSVSSESRLAPSSAALRVTDVAPP